MAKTYENPDVICPTCKDHGNIRNAAGNMHTCPRCHGAGWIDRITGKSAYLAPPPPSVHIRFDGEASAWIIEKTTVLGMAADAQTVDALLAKIKVMVADIQGDDAAQSIEVTLTI